MGEDVSDAHIQFTPFSSHRDNAVAIGAGVPTIIRKPTHPGEHPFPFTPDQPDIVISRNPVSRAGPLRLWLSGRFDRIGFGVA